MNKNNFNLLNFIFLTSTILALSSNAAFAVHGDNSSLSFVDRCKQEFDFWKNSCKKITPSKDVEGVFVLENCNQSVNSVTITNIAIEKEDSPSIGARKECRIAEDRKDKSRDLTIINSLGGKTVSYWAADGSFEYTIYAKGGGMLNCTKEEGDKVFTWCGINDAIMIDPDKTYDFLKARPQKSDFDSLISGSKMSTIFPVSKRTLKATDWYVHAKKEAKEPTSKTSDPIQELNEVMKSGTSSAD